MEKAVFVYTAMAAIRAATTSTPVHQYMMHWELVKDLRKAVLALDPTLILEFALYCDLGALNIQHLLLAVACRVEIALQLRCVKVVDIDRRTHGPNSATRLVLMTMMIWSRRVCLLLMQIHVGILGGHLWVLHHWLGKMGAREVVRLMVLQSNLRRHW